QRLPRVRFGFFQSALRRTSRAEVEIEERGEMLCFGVVLVERDGRERVFEGLSQLAAIQPEITRDIVLAFALTLGVLCPRSRMARTDESQCESQREKETSRPQRRIFAGSLLPQVRARWAYY